MPSYIVIVSPSYGGAEKRFLDIFTSLRRDGVDVVLVAPSNLINQFKSDYQDRQDVFEALVSVSMDSWSRLEFVRRFRNLMQSFEPGSNYHYPLNCLWPLHLGRGDKISMTVADCTSIPGPFAGRRTSIWTWISFFFVAKIDVLSPTILLAMRCYRMAGRMSMTPGGTFLIPPAASGPNKLPIVVFLGRLVDGKGIDDLLNILPDLWIKIRHNVPSDFAFQIAGYGALENHVAQRVTELAKLGVPITFIGYAAAEHLLTKAAVLLSMQEITNYPSRVVAEALLAGCGVIIRDTGDSREFGENLPGLVYCERELNAQEISDKLVKLINSVVFDPGFIKNIRNFALKKFNSTRYVDYYRDILSG